MRILFFPSGAQTPSRVQDCATDAPRRNRFGFPLSVYTIRNGLPLLTNRQVTFVPFALQPLKVAPTIHFSKVA